MLRVDKCAQVIAANTAFGSLVARDVEELVDRTLDELFIEGASQIGELLAKWLGGTDSSAHMLTLRSSQGPLLSRCLGMPMGDGSLVLRVVPDEASSHASDFGEYRAELDLRKDAHERLATMLLHDELTGLPNRVLFRDRLSAVLRQRTLKQHPCSVLFLDLDSFKEINDSHGHSVGDEALREVATRLSATVRPGDTVARVGGDEFVVLLPDVDNATAMQITERILESLRNPFMVEAGTLKLEASVGVVAVRENAESEQVIDLADSAMYQVKAAGGDGWLAAQSAVA